MQGKNRIKRYSRLWLPLLTVLIILALVITAIRNNIHVVIPNQVIRSSQLSLTTLNVLTRVKGIKSIINLRGENPGSTWYQQEILNSKQLNIAHYDIALSSKQAPSPQTLQHLITLLQEVKKPVLIHCESGADRSGLVSALALILFKNTSVGEASKQFSWRYLVTAKDSVGKVVFENYKTWLTARKLTSNKDNLLRWINSL